MFYSCIYFLQFSELSRDVSNTSIPSIISAILSNKSTVRIHHTISNNYHSQLLITKSPSLSQESVVLTVPVLTLGIQSNEQVSKLWAECTVFKLAWNPELSFSGGLHFFENMIDNKIECDFWWFS